MSNQTTLAKLLERATAWPWFWMVLEAGYLSLLALFLLRAVNQGGSAWILGLVLLVLVWLVWRLADALDRKNKLDAVRSQEEVKPPNPSKN